MLKNLILESQRLGTAARNVEDSIDIPLNFSPVFLLRGRAITEIREQSRPVVSFGVTLIANNNARRTYSCSKTETLDGDFFFFMLFSFRGFPKKVCES